MSTRPPSAPLPLPPVMIDPPLASISPLTWTPPLPGSMRPPPLSSPPAPGADIESPPRRSSSIGPAMLTLPVPGAGVIVPPVPAEAPPGPPLATTGTKMVIAVGGAVSPTLDRAGRAAGDRPAGRRWRWRRRRAPSIVPPSATAPFASMVSVAAAPPLRAAAAYAGGGAASDEHRPGQQHVAARLDGDAAGRPAAGRAVAARAGERAGDHHLLGAEAERAARLARSRTAPLASTAPLT